MVRTLSVAFVALLAAAPALAAEPDGLVLPPGFHASVEVVAAQLVIVIDAAWVGIRSMRSARRDRGAKVATEGNFLFSRGTA